MSERNDNSKSVHTRTRPSLWQSIHHSLQFKTALLVILLTLILVSGGTALSLHIMSDAMFNSERHRAHEWSVSLASTATRAVAADDRNALVYCIDTLIHTEAVVYVAFADATGQIIASAENKPGLLTTVCPPNATQLKFDMLDSPRLLRFKNHDIACIDVTAPIFAAPKPGQIRLTQSFYEPRPIIGYLRIAIDVSDTLAKLNHIGRYLSGIALGLLLLVIPCTLIATRRLVSPLNELAATARALANGSLEARVSINSNSEIGDLARSFNVMANRVTQSQMELLQLAEELEGRVEERTRELEELASKDSLTNLYNRRHFSEVMQREFAAAGRYNSDLTCLMFDVDLFKQINDRYGHGTGDEMLIILARSIMSQLRSSDVAARFGGDEFILLLPQTSAASAISLADRILERFHIATKERFAEVQATISVGVASIKETRAYSAETLINQADLALYEAKASGRNCTKLATQSVAQSESAIASNI